MIIKQKIYQLTVWEVHCSRLGNSISSLVMKDQQQVASHYGGSVCWEHVWEQTIASHNGKARESAIVIIKILPTEKASNLSYEFEQSKDVPIQL